MTDYKAKYEALRAEVEQVRDGINDYWQKRKTEDETNRTLEYWSKKINAALKAAPAGGEPDGPCQHCGGVGCQACDARHLQPPAPGIDRAKVRVLRDEYLGVNFPAQRPNHAMSIQAHEMWDDLTALLDAGPQEPMVPLSVLTEWFEAYEHVYLDKHNMTEAREMDDHYFYDKIFVPYRTATEPPDDQHVPPSCTDIRQAVDDERAAEQRDKGGDTDADNTS